MSDYENENVADLKKFLWRVIKKSRYSNDYWYEEDRNKIKAAELLVQIEIMEREGEKDE
jgi:hypothetical protein